MDPRRCTNDVQRNHLKYIEEHGVSILSVAPRASDKGGGPSWTYSIGLWQQYQHPEVLIMGLDFGVSSSLINQANREIRDEGRRFDDGTAANDVLDGDYICFFQRIGADQFGDWFAGTRWFYDGNNKFEAVQMVWPNLEHLYPWQADASDNFKALQPLICSLPKRALQ